MFEPLKPCPFCGSDTPELRKHDSGEGWDLSWADVHCRVCEATIHKSARSALGKHVDEVVQRWNTRATDRLIDDMIRSLNAHRTIV